MLQALKNCFKSRALGDGFAHFGNILKTKHLLFLTLMAIAVSLPIHSAKADILSYFIDSPAGNLVYFIIYTIGFIALFVARYIALFGAWLVDVMLEPGIYAAVLNISDPASPVMVGWTTVRDFCNMFFIFFLLLIAFATIFRISEYSGKNILVKFIMAIFLINFSASIAGLVIDFGQIFMYAIAGWMGTFSGSGGAMGSLTSIADSFYAQYNLVADEYSLENTVGVVFAAIFVLVMGFIYIMLAGLLLVRIIMFAILIVLAPIAFFGIVLPSTRRYASEWWTKIFSYSLFGPLFLFFIYLASNMANTLKGAEPNAKMEGLGGLSFLAAYIVPYAVSLGMLAAAIRITKDLSIAGADRVIGGAMGIGKIAIGTYAGIKMAGGLGKKTAGGAVSRSEKLGKASDTLRGGYYKALEKGGMRGTALKGRAEMERKRDEKMKKVELEFGDLKSIDLKVLEEKAGGRLGTTEDKALLLKAAAAQGKLGEKDAAGNLKYAKYIPGAERALSKKGLEEITNKNLNLATETSENKKRINAAGRGDYSSFSAEAQGRLTSGETTGKEEVMRETVADLEKEGKAHYVQGLDNPEAAKAWHDGQTTEGRKNNIKRLSRDEQSRLAEGLEKNVITHTATNADYNALAPNVRSNDMKMRVAKIKIDGKLKETLELGHALSHESVNEVTKQLGTGELAKLDDESLKYVSEKVTISQIKNLLRTGEDETVEKIKQSLNDKLRLVNPAPRFTPGLSNADIQDKLDEIKKQIES